MMPNGYIPIPRSLFGDAAWLEKRTFSKAEAVTDLYQRAAYAQHKQFMDGKLIELNPGEVVASLRYLGNAWGWSKNKVASFLTTLENQDTISVKNGTGITIITVSFLSSYYDEIKNDGTAKGQRRDSKRTAKGQQKDKEEEGKKERRKIVVKEESANAEQWQRAVMLDDAFLETVKMRFKYTDADIGQRLEQFHADKKGLELLTHKTYSEYRSNFFYWLQKQPTNNNDKNVKNANGRNHQYLIHPDDARAIAADLAAEFGK